MNQILALTKYFLPAYKAGGPIRSLANMIDHLQEDFDFRVITRDRDVGDTKSFSGVNTNTWMQRENCSVYYCSPAMQNPFALWQLIRCTPHDVLYVNNFFYRLFGIVPVLLRAAHTLPRTPTIVATRGVFSPGAMGIHTLRKKAFLTVFNRLPIRENVLWHATSSEEEERIQNYIRGDITIKVAPNLPSRIDGAVEKEKEKEELSLFFMGRIAEMKNIEGAIRILQEVKVPVSFHLYGPIDDEEYWQHCRSRIKDLPSSVTVQYHGAVKPTEVAQVMQQHHVLFLPTLGENFGHVIAEALSCGRPVLISDQTPWQDLSSSQAGWALSLNNLCAFRSRIEWLYQMNASEFREWSNSARSFVQHAVQNSKRLERNRALFQSVL
jgi:glycosyltransferase involved in cell wall biosynthesis